MTGALIMIDVQNDFTDGAPSKAALAELGHVGVELVTSSIE